VAAIASPLSLFLLLLPPSDLVSLVIPLRRHP
jgi:hypothetical protein